MSTEAIRDALAELLDAHDADYTGWSTHEMTEHWRRVKDAARAALAQPMQAEPGDGRSFEDAARQTHAARAALAEKPAAPKPIGQDSRILHELAGAASLCWEPRPTGVFDTSLAIRFVEEALAELRSSQPAEPVKSLEQQLRDALTEMGSTTAQNLSAGDLLQVVCDVDAAEPAALSDERIREIAKESDLDWMRGFHIADDENRFEVFARAIERAVKGTT